MSHSSSPRALPPVKIAPTQGPPALSPRDLVLIAIAGRIDAVSVDYSRRSRELHRQPLDVLQILQASVVCLGWPALDTLTRRQFAGTLRAARLLARRHPSGAVVAMLRYLGCGAWREMGLTRLGELLQRWDEALRLAMVDAERAARPAPVIVPQRAAGGAR